MKTFFIPDFNPYLCKGFCEIQTLTQDTVSKQTKKHMMRMNKKPFYTAPEAEFLDVRFEENFLNSDPIKPWEPDDDPLE